MRTSSEEAKNSVAVVEKFWAIRTGFSAAVADSGFVVKEYSSLCDLDWRRRRNRHAMIVLGPSGSTNRFLESLAAIEEFSGRIPTLLCFDSVNRIEVIDTLKAGHQVCITADASRSEFLEAFDAALKEHRYLTSPILDLVCDMAIGVEPDVKISRRESDVLKLLSKGLTAKEIAASLNLSYHTVVAHKKKLMRKFGVNSQLSLLVNARLALDC